MSQNTSSAVMAQRREPPDSLDFFPTPAWATRALIERVLIGGGWSEDDIGDMDCWEPACGQGHMALPLREYFRAVRASDCHDYGFGDVLDFLMPCPPLLRPDFIVTNPPFRLAAEFALKAREIANKGAAMLVRTAFLESAERYSTLFKPHPPAIVAPFVERVPMFKGRVDRKGSTATSYAWLVWSKKTYHAGATRLVWIPPCRKRLEKDEDYPCRDGAVA